MSWEKRNRRRIKKAKAIYKALFHEPFPSAWEMTFEFGGVTDENCKVILLPYGLEDSYDYNALVHEFVHLRMPGLPHGEIFEKVVKRLTKDARKVK